MILLGVLLAAAAAFTLSASAGLGGSLILVPALSLLLGAKQGVALAAVLLAANNVFKVGLYRATIPWRHALVVLVATVVGGALGATALVGVPERVVAVAVAVGIGVALMFEVGKLEASSRISSPVLAFVAGATSGFSGTSGPLKGVAIRSLGLDRMHFVGAASLVSLGGDVAKAAVFFGAGLLEPSTGLVAALSVPLMAAGSFSGRHLNRSIGEPAFFALFWLVMAGYTVRFLA